MNDCAKHQQTRQSIMFKQLSHIPTCQKMGKPAAQIQARTGCKFAALCLALILWILPFSKGDKCISFAKLLAQQAGGACEGNVVASSLVVYGFVLDHHTVELGEG